MEWGGTRTDGDPKSPQLISHPAPGQHAGDTETSPMGVHEVECEHNIYTTTTRGQEMHMRGTPTDHRVMGRAQDEGGEEVKIEEVKSVRQKGGQGGSSEGGCGWGDWLYKSVSVRWPERGEVSVQGLCECARVGTGGPEATDK